MSNSDLSPAVPKGNGTPTDETHVVSTRTQVPINWVSSRTFQTSIESVVANLFLPSDFLVDGQVCWLGTVHLLLTMSLFCTWILPLHAVFFSSLILCYSAMELWMTGAGSWIRAGGL